MTSRSIWNKLLKMLMMIIMNKLWMSIKIHWKCFHINFKNLSKNNKPIPVIIKNLWKLRLKFFKRNLFNYGMINIKFQIKKRWRSSLRIRRTSTLREVKLSKMSMICYLLQEIIKMDKDKELLGIYFRMKKTKKECLKPHHSSRLFDIDALIKLIIHTITEHYLSSLVLSDQKRQRHLLSFGFFNVFALHDYNRFRLDSTLKNEDTS